MVLSATSLRFWRALDSARVVGIATAILVNIVVIAALTIPSIPIPYAQKPATDDYLHWVVTPPIFHRPIFECLSPSCWQRHSPPRRSATVQPIFSPAPIYPIDALRDGVSGEVVLKLLVDVQGNVRNVSVEFSSGDRRLDNAARDQVLHHWRFNPALRNGVPVQAITRLPVEFKLDRR
ncbi:MAG TPA: energy transducer TonB [Xanthomonadaceae bacterium]|jgi:protein TonB|nr:energy transducer TonB [Xanthomonadaceae bacterium]